MRTGEGTEQFTAARRELLALRRDASTVLANLFDTLSKKPEEARRLIGPAPPSVPAAIGASQGEQLRGEFLELRRDLAVVMSNLLLAAGWSEDDARRIVVDALRPKASR